MSDSIQLIQEDIRIRPSAIDGFYNCSYQWAKTFLEGITTIPSARAAIGTGIHKGVEEMWLESIKAGEKTINLGMMTDAAVESFREEVKEGVDYDDGESAKTAEVEIIRGTEAFVDDIVPYTSIPDAVEEFFTVEITDHPLITEVGGTVDYIQGRTIADVKTSKRKPSVANYDTQQATYKYLANANGRNVTTNLIQGVVLKKSGAEGTILPMEPSVEQAKVLINNILDTVEIAAQDIVPTEKLFRGNPKYYLCSPKYCSLYKKCPYVRGKNMDMSKNEKKQVKL